MAQLPAIFPDGTPIQLKTYPWIVNDQICSSFPQLSPQAVPFAWVQRWGVRALLYWATIVQDKINGNIYQASTMSTC